MNIGTVIAAVAAVIGFLGWLTAVWQSTVQRRAEGLKRLEEEKARSVKEALDFSDVMNRLGVLERAWSEHRPFDDRINDHETRLQLLERSIEDLRGVPNAVTEILKLLRKKSEA